MVVFYKKRGGLPIMEYTIQSEIINQHKNVNHCSIAVDPVRNAHKSLNLKFEHNTNCYFVLLCEFMRRKE